ncbi:MAG: RimK/LysX family protein [Campylobacterota bacterium]|nr:RimK/LysX family protein [Campylobacterota bacterium]
MEHNSTFENLNTEKPDAKMIIGEIENIRLVPPNARFKARIDTGAKTTSVDARNITPFERDGKQWVRFVCVVGDKKHTIERKVIKTVHIKRHGEEAQDRYVINMRIVLGTVSQLIHVNLNDRKSYKYPILIGRNFLRDYFIVDVAKKYQLKPMVLPK